MSWGAQNRSEDAKTPSVAGVRLIKPELDCCPIQPYKEKIHKRAVCVVKEGKGKGIVVVDDLEGEAVPE